MGRNREIKLLDQTEVYVALAITPIGLGISTQALVAPVPACGPIEFVGFARAGALCLVRFVIKRKAS